MPGRKEQEKFPWERGTSTGTNGLNGTGRTGSTGRQPAIPPRPPGMSRVDTPPAVPRVNRPQRQTRPPRNFRRRLLIFVGGLIVIGILIFVIVYGVTNLLIGVNASAGAANTAADFLTKLQSQDYTDAYQDLDANLTLLMSRQDFQNKAAADDKCYGPITNYVEVSGSATTSNNGNTQSYAYTITRSQLSKTYEMTLTLQKESDGTWDISSYGNDLGPAPPSATCK